MKDIAIFGAGGLGREIACLIRIINEKEPTWNLIGFFDDGIAKGEMISHFGRVLGDIDTVNSWDNPLNIVIAIGNPTILKSIVSKITNPIIQFPNIIHPNFIVTDPETLNLGIGNIITSDCTFTCDVSVGNFNLLNGSVVLAHDVQLGSFNTFMPAVRISGEVTIGEMNFFGVGSIILQQVKIGNNTRIGAGSVVIRNTKDGNLYIGNPAQKFKY